MVKTTIIHTAKVQKIPEKNGRPAGIPQGRHDRATLSEGVYYLRINVTKELLGCVNSGVRDLSEAKSDEIFAFAG